MTNEVYQINWPTQRKVLVRIYGEGVNAFFDREVEIRTFECMSRHGQGPRLLGRFVSGRVEEFINARTLSAADLHDPGISALIATKLREFHDLDMPGPKSLFLWERLRNWLKAALNFCSSKEAEEFCLEKMNEEIVILENILSGDNQRISFCHNDLQYGNIMIDEETRQVTIIEDYEYASFNPIAFDIANHFCEMAADYHTDTPHILDFTKYPDIEEHKRFVQIYLSSSGNSMNLSQENCKKSGGPFSLNGTCLSEKIDGLSRYIVRKVLDQISSFQHSRMCLFPFLSSTGEEPRDIEVDNLLQQIEKYALASHLFWGHWGTISAHVNKIDFDYMEYARQRFQQFWLMKPAILGFG